MRSQIGPSRDALQLGRRLLLDAQKHELRPERSDESGREAIWANLGGVIAHRLGIVSLPTTGSTQMSGRSLVLYQTRSMLAKPQIRPMQKEVVRAILGIIARGGAQGGILAFGDSATAYCVDKRRGSQFQSFQRARPTSAPASPLGIREKGTSALGLSDGRASLCRRFKQLRNEAQESGTLVKLPPWMLARLGGGASLQRYRGRH